MSEFMGGLLGRSSSKILQTLGGQMKERGKRERQGRVAQELGLSPNQNVVNAEGNVMGGKLGQGLMARGYWDEGSPFISQAITNREAMARQNDQQAHQFDLLSQQNANLLGSEQRKMQAIQNSARYAIPSPAALGTAQAAITASNSAASLFSKSEELYENIKAQGAREISDPGAQARNRTLMNEIILQSAAGEALTDREYAIRSEAMFGFNIADPDWTDLTGRQAAAGLGAMQQTVAGFAAVAKNSQDGLINVYGQNEYTSKMVGQALARQSPNIQKWSPEGKLYGGATRAAEKQKLTDKRKQQTGKKEGKTTAKAFEERRTLKSKGKTKGRKRQGGSSSFTLPKRKTDRLGRSLN